MKNIKLLFAGLLAFSVFGCVSALKEPPSELGSSIHWVDKNDVPDAHKNLKIIKRGNPFYPASALRENQQGWCVAQYDVSSEQLAGQATVFNKLSQGWYIQLMQ